MLERTLVVLAVVLATLAVSESAIHPAGRCPDTIPTPIDFNYLVSFANWKLVYVPNHPAFDNVDGEVRERTSTSNLLYKAINTITLADNSTSQYKFTISYGKDDGLVYEEDIDVATGETQQFKWIPILLTEDLALLYIRCSDTGSMENIITRFIVMPQNKELSAESEQQLLQADSNLHLSGGIRKLKRASQ